jgi:hypothetical protein
MQVIISFKIEVGASASLSEMESQIREAGRVASDPKPSNESFDTRKSSRKSVLAAEASRSKREGRAQRVRLPRFGRVEVPLRRQRCQACGQRFRPAASWLVDVKGHNVTSDLRELAALVGSSWPYETAAGVLKQLSGVHLSDERLRQITNEQGSTLAKQQREQAQQVLTEAVNIEQIRAQRVHIESDGKQVQP